MFVNMFSKSSAADLLYVGKGFKTVPMDASTSTLVMNKPGFVFPRSLLKSVLESQLITDLSNKVAQPVVPGNRLLRKSKGYQGKPWK